MKNALVHRRRENLDNPGMKHEEFAFVEEKMKNLEKTS